MNIFHTAVQSSHLRKMNTNIYIFSQNKLILLFRKDALNVSKMTGNSFDKLSIYQKIENFFSQLPQKYCPARFLILSSMFIIIGNVS